MASKRSNSRSDKTPRGRNTLEDWRANTLDVEFSAEDIELLDNVLTVAPVLRVVAAIGQEARRRGLRYPVAGVADLTKCLGRTTLRYGRHRVAADTIAETMPDAWFPIEHEGDLLSRVHLALLRCEMEALQAAPRPALC